MLVAAEEQTGVPMLVDRFGMAQAGVDLAKARVTSRPRNTSWSVVLRSVTLAHRLRHDLRRDEGGQPVVWVTPIRLGRP